MTIYGVFHCDYDGGGILSHHQTKRGAYQEMRRRFIADYTEWYNDRILYGKSRTRLSQKHRSEYYRILMIDVKN